MDQFDFESFGFEDLLLEFDVFGDNERKVGLVGTNLALKAIPQILVLLQLGVVVSEHLDLPLETTIKVLLCLERVQYLDEVEFVLLQCDVICVHPPLHPNSHKVVAYDLREPSWWLCPCRGSYVYLAVPLEPSSRTQFGGSFGGVCLTLRGRQGTTSSHWTNWGCWLFGYRFLGCILVVREYKVHEIWCCDLSNHLRILS